ncbi:MAG: Gfo/Idh/MocA family protein [Xenococcaceae cyanobacterium]
MNNEFQSNPNSNNSDRNKIRYGVVGLGWITQVAVLPAFANAENSELVALFFNDRDKLEILGQQYSVSRTYSYDEYKNCLDRGEIDAVYIALPNHLHREYTIKAADAGVHVLCEKPMAVTEDECQAMIDACEDNRVKLMIAYRLHLEEANMQAVEMVRSRQIGEPRFFNSLFAQKVEENNVRRQKDAGGGTLEDMGIYCINAARYLFGEEPIEVFATSARKPESHFEEVEEMTNVIMRFPKDKLASFTASFGTAPVSNFQIVGTKGDLRLDPAYSFQDDIKLELTIDGKKQEKVFPKRDQFAAELIYFSDCILQDTDPEPSGQEGLNDIRIISALYQSMETGSFVKIENQSRELRLHRVQSQKPSLEQTIERPPIEEPDLIRAADPSGKE